MKFQIILFALIIVPIFSFAQSSPQGLLVNDKAPEFTAKDQKGKLVNLSAVLKNGPAVIVFYRGQWCPYCSKQLKELEDSIGLIQGKGATLIAISPEKQENIAKTVEKSKASYPVLFDKDLKIMRSYDVAFQVDSNTVERYKKFGIDLYNANGSNGTNLPVPTVYIINREGIIIFKHFDPDYKKRVSVQEILLNL